jgi:hypothetical protein
VYVFFMSNSEVMPCLSDIFQLATIAFNFIYSTATIFIGVLVFYLKVVLNGVICSVCYSYVVKSEHRILRCVRWFYLTL